MHQIPGCSACKENGVFIYLFIYFFALKYVFPPTASIDTNAT